MSHKYMTGFNGRVNGNRRGLAQTVRGGSYYLFRAEQQPSRSVFISLSAREQPRSCASQTEAWSALLWTPSRFLKEMPFSPERQRRPGHLDEPQRQISWPRHLDIHRGKTPGTSGALTIWLCCSWNKLLVRLAGGELPPRLSLVSP